MLINKNEAETMTKHISCDCKCKFNSSTCNLNKKRNKKSCQHECKNYRTCICENSKYLKSIGDTSVIDCDEIITVLGIVSTIKTNTITANVTSSASINYHSIKVRNRFCDFAYSLVSDHITIDNYYDLLSLCKTKMH